MDSVPEGKEGKNGSIDKYLGNFLFCRRLVEMEM